MLARIEEGGIGRGSGPNDALHRAGVADRTNTQTLP